jgi:serine/threonine protein kinase
VELCLASCCQLCFLSSVVLPGVANRDIKLDNILLDRSLHGKADWPILKICDWGYAKHDAKSIAKSRVVSDAAEDLPSHTERSSRAYPVDSLVHAEG